MQLQQTSNVGRKARVGKVYFVNGRLHFFAGYAICDNCVRETKVVLPRSNAEDFAKLFGVSKTPVGARSPDGCWSTTVYKIIVLRS